MKSRIKKIQKFAKFRYNMPLSEEETIIVINEIDNDDVVKRIDKIIKSFFGEFFKVGMYSFVITAIIVAIITMICILVSKPNLITTFMVNMFGFSMLFHCLGYGILYMIQLHKRSKAVNRITSIKLSEINHFLAVNNK